MAEENLADAKPNLGVAARRIVGLLTSYNSIDLRNFLNFLRVSMKDRYMGSRLGMAWSIIGPMLMMAIFTFVFGFVFKARAPGAETSLSYVIWLIAGYGPWLFLSEGLSAGTSAFVKHSALIRNISFKRELLVFAEVLTGIIPMLVAVVFLAALLVADGRHPNWSWTVLPLVLLLQYVFVSGLALALGSVNVFVRDIMLALPNILLMLLFATPIFYPVESFPGVVQKIAAYNPIYVMTDAIRGPILRGEFPSAWNLAYAGFSAGVALVLGMLVFSQLRPYFDSRV